MAVKGTKIGNMQVVSYSPFARFLRSLLLLAVFAGGLLGSYFAGMYRVNHAQTSQEDARAEHFQQLIDDLTKQITALHTTGDVDRQSLEALRQVVMTQKAQLVASERDLRVYKDLLSPFAKVNPLGISVGVFTVLPTKDKARFSYSLTVQKLATKEVDFDGFVDVMVVGEQAGKLQSLPLNQISSQFSELNIPLSFKFFQTLEGEMTLPADFVPQKIDVIVRAGDKKSSPIVEAHLDWPATDVAIK